MVGQQKKLDRKMLKAGDLARQEDHRVRGSKAGEPDQIGGYHMYDGNWLIYYCLGCCYSVTAH